MVKKNPIIADYEKTLAEVKCTEDKQRIHRRTYEKVAFFDTTQFNSCVLRRLKHVAHVDMLKERNYFYAKIMGQAELDRLKEKRDARWFLETQEIHDADDTVDCSTQDKEIQDLSELV